MNIRDIIVNLLVYTVITIVITSCSQNQKKVKLKGDAFSLNLEKEGFRFSFSNASGETFVPAHSSAGLELNGDAIVEVTEVGSPKVKSSSRVFSLTNANGDKASIELTFENGVARFEVTPENDRINEISLRLGGMPVAHGLGDAAAYEEDFNIIKNKRETYDIENNGGGKRWASTFTIFPQNFLAGVFFDQGKKTVNLNEQEYKMTITKEGEATFFYFLGSPKDIYKSYKTIRIQNGYVDIQPKFRLFELGWESWDALGWNTNQNTVQDILKKFHDNGYPIRWAVTGSGFWETGGTTTSFGKWGEKFPDPQPFKEWMHNHDIKWMIGLRTNFVPGGGPFYPVSDKRDKNLKVTAFNGNGLSVEAMEKGFLVKQSDGEVLKITSGIFPIVPSYLLNGNAPGAAQWYQQQYEKWGVDGIKEDTMMDIDSLTNIYNSPITEIASNGGLVMARNGNFTAPGTLLRINDTGVGNLARRIPINYFQYAASGFPNVYSDVAGVHNMHNINDIDRSIRHTWLLSLTSGLAVGAYPGKWPTEKQKIFKKAIDFHYSIAPYMYSAAIDSYETGYPYTLTPLTIAFPQDSLVAKLEHFQWMIGESILAAPLLKNHKSGKMDVYLPEGVWCDYESGKSYEGPITLKDYEMTLDKIPCFIGGNGIIILRDSDKTPLRAKIYPIGKKETTFSFTYPNGNEQSSFRYKKWKSSKGLVVMDNTVNDQVPFLIDENSGAISFGITPNHNYTLIEKKI